MQENVQPGNGGFQSCLNCGQTLAQAERFCPSCGQKNTPNKLSFSDLFGELIDVLLNLDSKFFRTLRDFLIKPGHLTNAFVRGQRVAYVHPLRLYMVSCVVYFFVFAITGGQKEFFDLSDNGAKTLVAGGDSLLTKISEAETPEAKFQEAIKAVDLKNTSDSLEGKNDSDSWILFGYNLTYIKKLATEPKMSPEALLDSLNETHDPIPLKIASQFIKVGRNDSSVLAKAIIDNIPAMLLFVLPVYAFILSILYIRSKRYYVEHLIFALHLHAFVFVVLAIAHPIYKIFHLNTAFFFLPGIGLYSVVMFMKVYRQGIVKTLIKCGIIAFVYSFVVLFFSIAEALYSILSL